jgi:hypothetical protein
MNTVADKLIMATKEMIILPDLCSSVPVSLLVTGIWLKIEYYETPFPVFTFAELN